MSKFSFVLLYVDNPPASAAFYADLLGNPAVETSPTFAMLPLSSEVMLGLWSRRTDAGEVERTHDDWKGRGLPIVQKPTAMDFGHTFVALDPDGHRLRVFAPAQA